MYSSCWISSRTGIIHSDLEGKLSQNKERLVPHVLKPLLHLLMCVYARMGIEIHTDGNLLIYILLTYFCHRIEW